MPNVSDTVAENLLFNDLEVLRVEASERRRVLRLIRELEDELRILIVRHNPLDVEQRASRQRRIELLRSEILKASRATYRTIGRTQTAEMTDLIAAVGDETRESLNEAVGFRLIAGATTIPKARTLSEQLLVRGAPVREWWDEEAEGLARRFTQQIREGARVSQPTLDDLIRRTMGTRAHRGADGVVAISRRQAESLVRTSMQAAVNEARMAIYAENGDVIAGVQASNPLDSRTSPICIARAGQAWILETGEPFPGSFGTFPGAPPWHWGCRTILIPIFRAIGSLSRLRGGRGRGIRRRMASLAAQKKAGLDGKPAAGLTVGDALKRRSPAFVKDALGPTKYRLWNEGKIGVRDLIDQTGRPLTVAELKDRFATRRERRL